VPLYSIKTKRTFLDAIEEPYVWEFYIEVISEQLAKEVAVREFKYHIQDFKTTLEELQTNEVKRALLLKTVDGLAPLYYAALGEFEIEEIAKGLLFIKMTPA
jgi:hypothetical protein